MAYDEDFAHRVRELLADQDAITEKAMFGGLAFLLHGNMAVGISSGDELMVRVGADATDDALGRPHTRLFDMTGRPMKGWILSRARRPQDQAPARRLGRARGAVREHPPAQGVSRGAGRRLHADRDRVAARRRGRLRHGSG
jgi:hypothetical protein